MLTLAINTASSVTSIALLSGNEILGEKSWPSHNNEAAKLMPEIDTLLKQFEYKFSDLEGVLAICGPGSFTGLRIGVTTANTIAYLLGCKLFAVNTFEYWHVQSALPVLVFAGKGGVYFSSNIEGTPSQLTLEELPQVLKSKSITEVCGDISEEQKQLLAAHSVGFHPPALTFGQVCSKIISQPLENLKTIVPLYIKEPSITLSKK